MWYLYMINKKHKKEIIIGQVVLKDETTIFATKQNKTVEFDPKN